jgi:hypothetical protein
VTQKCLKLRRPKTEKSLRVPGMYASGVHFSQLHDNLNTETIEDFSTESQSNRLLSVRPILTTWFNKLEIHFKGT